MRFIIAKLSEGLYAVPFYQRVILSSMRIFRVVLLVLAVIAMLVNLFSHYRDNKETKVRLIQIGKFFLLEVFAHFGYLIIQEMWLFHFIRIEQSTMNLIVFILEVIALAVALRISLRISRIKRNKRNERKAVEQSMIQQSILDEED